MSDNRIIWERYHKLNEANLISTNPLYLELEKLLKEKGVQNPQIKDWLLKTYIKWFKSPADDNQKTSFIDPYQAKDTDPDWAKKGGIFQFNQFTPEYKDRLLHVIDFLTTKDEFYLKSLFKVTVPQMFQEVQKWDQEMERSSEKAKNAKLQSVEGTDYEVVGVYSGYPIWKLTSNKAFREESMYMGHCVGQAEGERRVTSVDGDESRYFKEYKNHRLEIYSLRDPKENHHPVVTFELREDTQDGEFKIYQIKGPSNRSVSERYRKACREFIEAEGYIVKEDGENIGMVNFNNGKYDQNNRYYFEDSKEFKYIYNIEIIPKQQKVISEIFKKIKNGYIDGTVDLNNLFLKELPDLTNIKVTGSFDCSNNRLTTLKGAPQEVAYAFYCGNNKLISLENAPKVTSNFICNYNKLTTLKGAPEKVEFFDCSNNELTTLKYGPKSASNDYICAFNQLTTLKDGPKLVQSTFDCRNNQLTTLDEAPEVEGAFFCQNNSVEFTEFDIIKAKEKARERNKTKLESFKQFYTKFIIKNNGQS